MAEYAGKTRVVFVGNLACRIQLYSNWEES